MQIDAGQIGPRILLLIGQIFVLLVCIAYIEYIYSTDIYPDKLANDTFQEVPCFIVNKKLSVNKGLVNQYRADFLISYQVDAAQYNTWVSGNGLDLSFYHDKKSQESILAKYSPGSTYTCYFDPKDPQVAILVQRYNWLSTFPLIIPSVVGLMTFYLFLRNLSDLIRAFKRKES